MKVKTTTEEKEEQTVKHAKVREVASLKIVFGLGKFFGRKVWKGQVYGKLVFAEISAR